MRTMILAVAGLLAAFIASAGTIAPYAVTEVTKDQYPKAYAAWGEKGVAQINFLTPSVAHRVSQYPECDRVETVELSPTKSVPREKMIFFVDCANGKRFYVDRKDILSY